MESQVIFLKASVKGSLRVEWSCFKLFLMDQFKEMTCTEVVTTVTGNPFYLNCVSLLALS